LPLKFASYRGCNFGINQVYLVQLNHHYELKGMVVM
jgi:hypothetical protein